MRIRTLGITVIMLAFLVIIVDGYPPISTEFYGRVWLNNDRADPMTQIISYDSTSVQCGSFRVRTKGYFGALSCTGDDNSTIVIDEGADNNEQIRFTINGQNSTVIGDGTFTSGIYKNITLIAPIIICGDGICQKDIEIKGFSNITFSGSIPVVCQADCGTPTVPNATPQPNVTNTSGGGGGGASSGGGKGGGSAAGGGKITGEVPFNITECQEDWNCTEWSECFSNETQYRSCYEVSSCNTTNKKPHEFQECIYEGNCYDGVQNGKENGIDCGGPCRPCPGKEKEPHCFDGLRNCHSGSCEDGVDCGGPCANSCEKQKKVEAPLRICNKPSDLFRPQFVILYIVIIILSYAYISIEYERAKKIKKNKKLSDVERAKKFYAIKHQIIFFIIFVTLLFSSLMGFYVFFFCKKSFYSLLEFLLLALAIIPLIAFFFMKLLEYDEKKKLKLLEMTDATHKEHLKKLVMLQNDYLREIEVKLSTEVYALSKKGGFSDYLEKYPNLKTAYRDMLLLYDKYKEQKSAFGMEKELCDAVKQLEDDVKFQKLAGAHPEVKSIYDKLGTLYKAYEEKEELYEEIGEKEKIIEKKQENNE